MGDQQHKKYINATSALILTFNAQLLEYETWHVDPADQGKLSEKKANTTNALTHTHNTHWTHTHAHNTHTDYKVQVALHVLPEATTLTNDKRNIDSCAYETGEGDVEDGNRFDGNRFDAPPESNTTTDYGQYAPQLRRFRSEQGQVLIKVCSIDLRTNQGMTIDVFTNQGM